MQWLKLNYLEDSQLIHHRYTIHTLSENMNAHMFYAAFIVYGTLTRKQGCDTQRILQQWPAVQCHNLVPKCSQKKPVEKHLDTSKKRKKKYYSCYH